jgi:hypothetical protein
MPTSSISDTQVSGLSSLKTPGYAGSLTLNILMIYLCWYFEQDAEDALNSFNGKSFMGTK